MRAETLFVYPQYRLLACILNIEPGWQACTWQACTTCSFLLGCGLMIAKVVPAHPTNPLAIFVSGHRSPFEAI